MKVGENISTKNSFISFNQTGYKFKFKYKLYLNERYILFTDDKRVFNKE